MKRVSKLKAWLKRKGFVSTDYEGESEYFTLEGFPVIVRLADHVGRKGTETDKYINIIPDGVDTYVFIYDRITKTMSHKELIKAIESLVYLHKCIPMYFDNRARIKKQYEDTIREMKSKSAERTVNHRASLVKGLGMLGPIINDLQKLYNSFNHEKDKLK